ncbi:MAG: PGPGW domain-containing protein [Patescibacteria group bacterium]
MAKYFKKLFSEHPRIQKTFGVILITLGVIALLTPATPGAWLIFIGLGLFGVRIAWWDAFVGWLKTTWKKIRRKD